MEQYNAKACSKRNRWNLARLYTLILLSFSLVAITGCGTGTTRGQSYGNNGVEGYSNSNPNMINRHSTLSYQESINFIHELLAPYKGIKKQELRFMGSKILLNLRVDPNMPDADKKKLQSETQSKLEWNFPEYDVQVTVADR